MATVRQTIQRNLRNGRLTGMSDLRDVRGISDYLAPRIARSLRRGMPITLNEFWTATSRLTTPTLQRSLQRALQNLRGNQCVSTRIVGEDDDVYHTGDINQFGYEACVTLLDYNRTRNDVRYGALPKRLPERARGSKECGCRPRGECKNDALCILTQDGACVPRAHNTRGFVGVTPHPNQKERANDDAQRRRVRRRSHTRMTNSLRNDPASASDLAAGYPRRMWYSPRGNHMWRRPSPKVRLPARAY